MSQIAYKILRVTLLVASLLFLAWTLTVQGFFSAKDKPSISAIPPAARQSGGELRGPREGTPGVTYGTVAATSVDRPEGTHWRIYTVESFDGKSFTIHGFNQSGYHLSLASDDQIDPPLSFAPLFTSFSDQYSNGTKTVGTLTSSGNIWAARSWFGATWHLGATWVSSWAHRTAPPVLPGDGESVTVPGTKLQEGNEALILHFQTDPSNGTAFLIVATQKSVQSTERHR